MANVGCPACGELLPVNDKSELILREGVYVPEAVVTDLERELRAKRTRLTALTRDLAAERKSDPLYAAAERVYQHWVRAAGKNPDRVTFTEDREKAVLARLREAVRRGTAEEKREALKRREAQIVAAVDYVCANPYQLYSRHVATPTGNATKRVDLSYICAKGSRVEEWADLWEREV